MDFGDHDDETYGGDGFKTAYRYNGSIHESVIGQRRKLPG